MKFVLEKEPPQDEPVCIDTKIADTGTGSVAVTANGITVLWLKVNGTVEFNSMKDAELCRLGFQLTPFDGVKHA